MRQKRRQIWIRMILAGIVSASVLLPMVLTVADSFWSQEQIEAQYGVIFSSAAGASEVSLGFLGHPFSLEQYQSVLLNTPKYLFQFWNSMLLVVPITIFQILVGCLTAYGFTKCKGKLAGMIFFGYIVLMLMPYQVTVVPNYFVVSWLHLTDTNWAIWLPSIFAPFSVYLMTRYMSRIPSAFLEAAQIDGAGSFTIFRRIVMPMCKGQIASCTLLVFIDYWNMVEQPLILFSDSEKYPLSILLSRIETADVNVAFAASVIYMIPVWLLFLYVEDYFVEGMNVQGGLKQ